VISPTQRPLPNSTKHSQETDIPAGFEPTIPASERPQTHATERATTGIDTSNWKGLNNTARFFLKHIRVQKSRKLMPSNLRRVTHSKPSVSIGESLYKQMRSGNERQYRPTPIRNELQISTASHCWSSSVGDVLNRWTSVLEYYADEKRTRQQPPANYVQKLATVQNTEMNFLLLHCYGGLLQHNHTGSPITVATSGYTNARENNGNRRGVVIKTRTRDKTYAWRQWYRRDTVLLQCFRDSQMVQALINTLAPHELLDQSV